MTNRYIYLTLLAVLGFKAEMQADETGREEPPRLVVCIAIDQLRSDYLENFAPLYSEKGLKRLLREGTVCNNGYYPFSPVDRASAIATIVTGTTPYYNNIIGQRWLSRETLRPVPCVDDIRFAGLQTSDTSSPAELSTSTIGDELKVATEGKAVVYAIAPHRDAAVLSAGHAADGALWLDDANGQWCSSQYYFKKLPQWVKEFNNSYAPAYRLSDTGSDRYQLYKNSYQANADVTTLAEQCIVSTQMGTDDCTDLLCLTYNAGTAYQQATAETRHTDIQELYLRLDHEMERIVSFTERQLGAGKVLFVITSTGYCEEKEVDYEKYRIPTGTFHMSRTAGLVNMYFGAIWGQDKYVEAVYGNQLFFDRKLLEAKKISLADASKQAQELIGMMSGVRNVYTAVQLQTSQSEHLQKTRLGFSADHSGDLIVETAPGWRVLNEDTNESKVTSLAHFVFPIIFFGTGTQATRIETLVTTDQIAPTIARCIRIRAPNACSAKQLF